MSFFFNLLNQQSHVCRCSGGRADCHFPQSTSAVFQHLAFKTFSDQRCCISNGGAVLPAWFFNRPLYPAHVYASDSEFQKLLLVSGLVLSWRAFPQRMIPLSCGCSHNPFFLKEYTANSSFDHPFSLIELALVPALVVLLVWST